MSTLSLELEAIAGPGAELRLGQDGQIDVRAIRDFNLRGL